MKVPAQSGWPRCGQSLTTAEHPAARLLPFCVLRRLRQPVVQVQVQRRCEQSSKVQSQKRACFD